VPEIAEILMGTMIHYRDRDAYLLHEFVVMPDHLHLLLTPSATTSLEKSIQLVKGGSAHEIHKQRDQAMKIWQEGFYDWTIRDANDWQTKVEYIRMNPVRARLALRPQDWPYSSASGRFTLNAVPNRYAHSASGAKALVTPSRTPGLKPRPPEESQSDPAEAFECRSPREPQA
jgi:putative transposase